MQFFDKNSIVSYQNKSFIKLLIPYSFFKKNLFIFTLF
jgi:hypothetical protein